MLIPNNMNLPLPKTHNLSTRNQVDTKLFRDYEKEPFRHDFELDDTLHDVGYLNKGIIEIKSLPRRHFPKKVVKSHANYLLNKGLITGFECFYSRVRCWMPNFTCNGHKFEHHFALTKDHAVPVQVAKELGGTSKHLVMSSEYLNYKLGHMPLAMKLWIRSQLTLETYDLFDHSNETVTTLRHALIKINDQFKDINGLYLYQPWTYKDNSSARDSLLFYNKLLEVDREFLQLHGVRDAYTWLSEYDVSWLESMRVR